MQRDAFLYLLKNIAFINVTLRIFITFAFNYPIKVLFHKRTICKYSLLIISKMNANISSRIKILSVMIGLLSITPIAQAQFLRTSYFMEGASQRTQLNPALQPTRGYINFPVLGMFNASASSNSLSAQDVIDIIDSSDDFYRNDKFMNRLKTDNSLNASINTDVISFGFFRGKSFWSFNAGLRTDIYASVPKTMFEYMREMDAYDFDWSKSFDVRNQQVRANVYTEIGVGYSRPINDRLMVGARLKFLGGGANMKLNVENIYVGGTNIPSREDVYSNPDLLQNMSADIRVKATMEGSFKGLELEHNDEGYIDELSVGGYGVAGYGGAIDLGASYRVLDNLTVSGALLDLGFISWSAGSSRIAQTSLNEHYDQNNWEEFYNRTEGGDVLDFDLLQFKEEKADKGRNTSLASTLVLGAEYAILNNKVAFGVLSTNRFLPEETFSEITLSANYRPKSWFNAALSYSMIQSAGKSFGAAVKIGPLLVGTDYMFLGDNTKCANAYLGLSFAIGKARR